MAENTESVFSSAGTTSRGRGFRLRTLNAIMVVLVLAAAFLFLRAVHDTNETYKQLEHATSDYILSESAASELKAASNYLTIQVRSFVVTQDPEYLRNYFEEANVTRRREHALDTFSQLEADTTALTQAMAESVELMDQEYYAMELVTQAAGLEAQVRPYFAGVALSPEDAALSPEAKLARAVSIVFGDEYMDAVSRIESNVANAKDALIAGIEETVDEAQASLDQQLARQRGLAIVLSLLLLLAVVVNMLFVVQPLRIFGERIRTNNLLPHIGAAELRQVAEAYNEIYTENMRSHDVLRRKAEHDALTGLYNRGVFEQLLEYQADEPYGLMIVDVDHFKEVNDTYGHDVGDALLKKLSGLLTGAFRTTDYPCRLGGDEFVVFLASMTADLRDVVAAKVEGIRAGLADTSDGLPASTVSVGVAFSDGTIPGEEAFKRADRALYKVKEAGRNGYAFFEE